MGVIQYFASWQKQGVTIEEIDLLLADGSAISLLVALCLITHQVQ